MKRIKDSLLAFRGESSGWRNWFGDTNARVGQRMYQHRGFQFFGPFNFFSMVCFNHISSWQDGWSFVNIELDMNTLSSARFHVADDKCCLTRAVHTELDCGRFDVPIAVFNCRYRCCWDFALMHLR